MRPSILALALAALLPSAALQAQYVPRSDGMDGMGRTPGPPVEAVSPLPNWHEVRFGIWHVPLATVDAMRTQVKERLGANKWFAGEDGRARYAIQFRGERRDGRRIVRLAGFCQAQGFSPRMLSADFLKVYDGGECNFDAEYDLQEQRLVHFKYHGHA